MWSKNSNFPRSVKDIFWSSENAKVLLRIRSNLAICRYSECEFSLSYMDQISDLASFLSIFLVFFHWLSGFGIFFSVVTRAQQISYVSQIHFFFLFFRKFSRLRTQFFPFFAVEKLRNLRQQWAFDGPQWPKLERFLKIRAFSNVVLCHLENQCWSTEKILIQKS